MHVSATTTGEGGGGGGGESGVPSPGKLVGESLVCFRWRGGSGVPYPGKLVGESLVCFRWRGGSGVPSPESSACASSGGEGLVWEMFYIHS